MEAHPADAQLQADACQALTFPASHSPEYKQRVCEAGGALAIVRALEAHGSVAAVALQGCGALAVLTMETTARAAVREAGGVPPLVGFAADPHTDLQANAAGAIQSICFQKEGRAYVREQGAIQAGCNHP